MVRVTCYKFVNIGAQHLTDVMMPAPRDVADLVKAARLYFQDGLSQHEVAQSLGTSRSNVSRMLAAARERGIVQVRIVDPAGRDNQLEEQLAERFGLAEVRVASTEPGRAALARTGQLGSVWLLDALRDGHTVGLSWGTALQQLVWATTTDRPRQVELVQLVGGLSPVAQATTGQELVRELAAGKPVGDVCARYFDIDGRPVGGPVDERVLAVSLADLRRIPTVVGLASGKEKAPGVLGALRGRILDVLVCDAGTARAVLALDREGARR